MLSLKKIKEKKDKKRKEEDEEDVSEPAHALADPKLQEMAKISVRTKQLVPILKYLSMLPSRPKAKRVSKGSKASAVDE